MVEFGIKCDEQLEVDRVERLGVKWWKQRVGVRMLRVELGHPRAALGRSPKLFGDGACGRAGVW